MSYLTVLEDAEENEVLLNPNFRKGLSIFVKIKEEHGIDVCDYDSFEDFMKAFFSSLSSETLERAKEFEFDGSIGKSLDAALKSTTIDV